MLPLRVSILTNKAIFLMCVIVGLMVSITLQADDDSVPSKFKNSGGVFNTRHNMAQSVLKNPGNGVEYDGGIVMNPYRNNYGEVCVYCHTPHSASMQINAPLWNRTFNNNTYTTYGALGSSSIDGDLGQPGVNSLTCLSCHDGTLPVDTVVNMPGSGNQLKSQETTLSESFLNNSWTNADGPDASVHMGLNGVNEDLGCLACHSSDASRVGAGAVNFKSFAIGTDLRDDHPIGVQLPIDQLGKEFVEPTGTLTGMLYYDNNGNNAAAANEIRYYITGNGPEVECASCHDPHGVWNGEKIKENFIPSFLRVKNAGSAVCYACHIK